jgi:hypothetical protein
LYDVPFTLPVFRMHLLGETLSGGTVVDTYDTGYLTNGQYNNSGTLTDNSKRDGTLVRTFKRMGCM